MSRCKYYEVKNESSSGGSNLRNLRVEINGQGAAPSSGVWYARFGNIDEWFGNSDVITIIPAEDDNSSDRLVCSKNIFNIRVYMNIQSANFGGNPRAFLSMFVNGGPVQGAAVSPAPGSNNNREQIILESGGLLADDEITLSMAWNGNSPLTVNAGLSYVVITYLENPIVLSAGTQKAEFTLTEADFP